MYWGVWSGFGTAGNYKGESMKALIIATAIILSGCSTYATTRYSISVDNAQALKSLKGNLVKVGNFTSFQPGLSSITCRGTAPIKTPDGQPYSEYIRKAFVDELKISDIYSDDATVLITGQLNTLDFSSNSGQWNMSLTLNSSNGNSLTAHQTYNFTTSYNGDTACNQTAQALMPAVQDLIGKIVKDQEFKRLIKN